MARTPKGGDDDRMGRKKRELDEVERRERMTAYVGYIIILGFLVVTICVFTLG